MRQDSQVGVQYPAVNKRILQVLEDYLGAMIQLFFHEIFTIFTVFKLIKNRITKLISFVLALNY